QGDDIFINTRYYAAIFTPETIQRMASHFKNIIKHVSSDSFIKLKDIEIISTAEKKKIIYEFNNTEIEYPKDKTIQHQFAEQVSRTGDHIAILGFVGKALKEEERIHLSYRELDNRTNHTANQLSLRHIRPGTIIAIMVEPTLEMVIGIMGILKAGGVFLPIEPNLPVDRVNSILNDSKTGILLTQTHLLAAYKTNIEIIHIDNRVVNPGESLNIISDTRPADPLYVLYTSGTTGSPKGVLIAHKNMVNYVYWFVGTINLSANDRAILTTSFAFDAFYTQFFSSLLTGCELHVIPRETFLVAERLLKYLRQNKITYIKVTPSLFNLIVDDPGFSVENLKRIRLFMLGGEAIKVQDVEKAHKLCPHFCMMNHYGPTETTIGSIAQFIDFDKFEEYKSIPTIGKPIHNTWIYIMDRAFKIVPIGVPGDLYIGGDGVGMGYVNKQELTAEKFFPLHHVSSISHHSNSKFYYTGDLARWHEDGNIQFLGRIDHQVKIRGFRVEIEEIEKKLLSYDGIETSAVLVMNEKEENYLCAYFTSNRKLDIKEIRNYLAKQLPNYMIPSYFNRIERMPLTIGGKIDRKGLASIGHKGDREIEYIAPQTEIEKKVTNIWKEVLKIEQIGIYDNFFNIGGNSLKLITLSSKLNTALRTNIPIAKLFEHVTISAFVQYLSEKESEEEGIIKSIARPGVENDKLKRMNDVHDEIAIIGIAGRFPGARNIDEFWHNLENGIESIKFMTDEELNGAGIDTELLKNPNYVKVKGGVLEDKDCFDATFFDYLPFEAMMMDPQVRIFHECAWETLENAGYDPTTYEGLIGIYAGASSSSNWEGLTYFSGKREMIGNYAAGQLANKDLLCSRIAYKLDLKGPAINVNAACSTSLVAVHMACRAILNGDCDMALAGGVSVTAKQTIGYIYQEGMIFSTDGHCRAFDADAGGTVGGNGAGIVLLKPLEKAVADCDCIHAIIRGTAINNDGIVKAGYTAPSIKGQATAIRAALYEANVDPETITYIETHGTGTMLGDPIEIEALKQAYHTNKKQYCAIGSVKTNIGHLDAAAGIAGLIKTVLVLKNKLIPPSLHYKKANPKIDF
ncbi:MAG TPA: amino acid adenylation domain-containing protein, partial [Candidatus Kapabacteria bacterium]|nr:amino acid adenylation domain-containing protein [Candidatus Kapabacteria bacterium]